MPQGPKPIFFTIKYYIILYNIQSPNRFWSPICFHLAHFHLLIVGLPHLQRPHSFYFLPMWDKVLKFHSNFQQYQHEFGAETNIGSATIVRIELMGLLTSVPIKIILEQNVSTWLKRSMLTESSNSNRWTTRPFKT